MGAYGDGLRKRMRDGAEVRKPKQRDPNAERLVSVAIVRNGETLSRGFKSHYELRLALDPDNPDPRDNVPGDIDGFLTSTGRFVDRNGAKAVAIAAGQIGAMWEHSSRKLLSSDIDWF